MSFLFDLSKNIVSSGIPLQETVVVLPNERARRMLLHHLTQNLKLPAFLPAIYSIEHFMDLLSPLQTLDKLELLTSLYESTRKMDPPVAESFDDMLTWAPAYLSDIDEIDMQMQDGEYVFRTLAFDKEFTIAMADEKSKEALQEKMSFYARLAELYTLFRQHLRNGKCAYSGLKFRDCAENMDKYATKLNFKHFVFAGFHVFTPSELAVVRYIKDHYDAQFFFDVDPFYCDFQKDDRFTTAYFLKKICSGLDMPLESVQFVNHHYEEVEKKIQIVGAAKEMNQIYYAIGQLERIKQEQGSLDDTALVLADEQLLVPFLSAFDVKEANVTMGYPIKATPAYTLLNSLLDMYQTALRYSKNGVMRFHHRDVVAVLRNPIVRKCLFQDEKQYKSTLAEVEDNQRALFSQENLPTDCFPVFSVDTETLLPELVRYFEQLLKSKESESKMNTLLNMMYDALNKANVSLQRLAQQGSPMQFSTIKYAIGLQLDRLTLAFKGNPLKGLQIMGLLETRTLDFKHVIILSVNEGVLPAGISYNTLLPFEIKYDNHSLPNYLYKDQVYAYHFFRLLQRAEDIVLLYNNVSDVSLVEKSRFISQLEFLHKELNLKNIELQYPTVGFQYKAAAPDPIEVPKTDEMLEKLRQMRYSATSLNQYINCPLQFYLGSVCKIQPRQTFQEKVESNIIGTVVHSLLQDVFDEIKEKPTEHRRTIDEFLQHIKEKIEDKLLNADDLKLYLTPFDLTHGRIYLAIRMIENDVRNYLEKAKRELEIGKVKIVGNEIDLEVPIQVGSDQIRLHGIIDRLQVNQTDSQTNIPVVVDYKTGSVDELIVKPEALDALFKDPKYKQMVQVLIYALLLKYADNPDLSQLGGSPELQCGIISIKDSNKNLEFPDYWHPASFGEKKESVDKVNQDVLTAFEASLKDLLVEILNPKKTFNQASDEKHCKNCNYKQICQR